jgi:hypothetical protein
MSRALLSFGPWARMVAAGALLGVVAASLPSAVTAAGSQPQSRRMVLVLATAAPMTTMQRKAASSVLTHRIRVLGLTGSVVTHPRELVISVAGRLGATQYDELATPGRLLFGPVLCWAGRAQDAQPHAGRGLFCGERRYQLARANLDVVPDPSSASGYSVRSVPTDPRFSSMRSTAAYEDLPGSRVLLGARSDPSAQRYLLGPTGLSGRDVAQAVVQQQVGEWVVAVTLDHRGSSALDRLSKSSFHEYVAVDLDGHVLEAPLIEPAEVVWSSFSGQVEIAGPRSLDVVIAFVLRTGALPVETKLIAVRPSVRG